MKLIVFSIILTAVCLSSKAQVFMHGKTINRENGEAIDKVSVKNISTSQKVYSNEDGYYKIQVNIGDSVEFSRIGYFKYILVIENTSVLDKNIELRKQIKTLKEARIVGLTEYQKDSIERATLYSDPLSFEKEDNIMSPVSYVYQRVSKKYKNLEKFKETFKENEKQKFIDTKYTLKLVKDLTKLEDADAVSFMNTFPMDYEFARTATELEIKMWIKYNFKDWKK